MCPNTELFLVRIFPQSKRYSVRMRENTDQKTSVFGHFSRSAFLEKCNFLDPLYQPFANNMRLDPGKSLEIFSQYL